MGKIGIDFDGVLIDRQGIVHDDNFDLPPVKDAVEAITLLAKLKDCYVCTARQVKDWPKIKKWMKRWGFPSLKITNKKQPYTDVYLDDRAVRFTTWQDFCKLFR